MRVGLIIYGSLETVSGGYLYDRKLVEHLQHSGDSVELISLPPRSYTACLGDNWDRRLLWQLVELRCDVLLQDELNHPSLFRLNRDLHKFVTFPVVAIVHHLRCSEARPAWQNRLYRWVERRYLNSVDGFIFNSQTTRQAVAAVTGPTAAGKQERPAVVAYPAGDQFSGLLQFSTGPDDFIARRAAEPGPLRIVFLGNLIRRKGLHSLLEALARLPAQAASLTIVGSLQSDPAYTAEIRQQIARLGLEARASLLGPLETGELAALLTRQHVLAVPSSYEGYGIAYLEGMAAGLPAIGTTAGAAGEIITHDQDGFLLPPEDPQGLAACLQTLAADRSRLASLGQAAYRRYQAQPTWEQSAAQIRRFLTGLIERQS